MRIINIAFFCVILFILVYPIFAQKEDNLSLTKKDFVNQIEETDGSLIEQIVPDVSPQERLNQIQKKIKEKGARWQANLTSKALLSVEEKRRLLGTIIQSEKKGKTAISYTIAEDTTVPSYFDWRNKDGKNWMTPVKDASGCGACWAFAAVGAVEAAFNIFKNDSDFDIDLSEQQLISDGGPCLYHGDCYGGHHETALEYIRDVGIVDEECFPYTASDSSCNLCQDWENRLYKIEDYFWIRQYTPNTYKEMLMEYGPLPATAVVSDIFLYYSSGIYEPLDDESIFSGSKHAIVLIGWNDTGGYWIIKNDWGTGWGENGYGKVAYGNVEMWQEAYAITNVISPSERFEINLTEGWNLISVPLNLTNKTLPFPFLSVEDSYEGIFAYLGGKWKAYVPNSSSNTLPLINETLGIWVKTNKSDILTVYGSKPNKVNFTLTEGWNLIGSPSSSENITNTLQSINGCYEQVLSYWSNNWVSFNPARPQWLNTLNYITPGKGYWVKVNCSSAEWIY